MTGYWDIHNHILPGVDDGSGCMRETMEMLEEEYRQGVRHIVFTPLLCKLYQPHHPDSCHSDWR